MNRREFLGASGAGLAGVSMGLQSASDARAQTSSSPEVVVIGAGTFGAWTAYHLNRLGASVVLLDAYGPGNSRASSGGETRQMQADMNSDVYTRSAIDSYAWWKRIEQESGVPIVLETGKLMLSTTADNIGYAEEIQSRHEKYGLREVEILQQDELRYRWPQVNTEDIQWGAYSEAAAGCVMMARKGVETVANEFVKQGGTLQIAHCTPNLDASGNVTNVTTQDGTVVNAQHYVFACGPWLKSLFPELLDKRLIVQRRDVLFYGSPPGDSAYAFPRMPTWSVLGSGYYGFPDIENRGFKVAPYPDYNTIDPDNDERLIMPHQVKRGRAFLRKRFPGLGEMPISESRVCQVTDTADRNFMADRHPGSDNVWIVGGGSGHGFKHGPAVGEHVAKRIVGEAADDAYVAAYTVMKDEFA